MAGGLAVRPEQANLGLWTWGCRPGDRPWLDPGPRAWPALKCGQRKSQGLECGGPVRPVGPFTAWENDICGEVGRPHPGRPGAYPRAASNWGAVTLMQ
ncbi:hypothetical protein NDU88_006828 [Pleurodeles waltl]|uniref:Uncharacterized protein n=1 Tax=Pleurodeles waltl TaxID=8319 RepID=A0AAV7VRS6_PLEWA|nr:hypothetical protein NDU88_006828 [Pleurodeles waltl]